MSFKNKRKERSPAGNRANVESYRSYISKKRLCYQLNYTYINTLALSVLPSLLQQWLPNGVIKGHEYVTCNPMREDRSSGSFKVNLRTGKWADFATGDGGDIIALAAYLSGTRQSEAARQLYTMLGGDYV